MKIAIIGAGICGLYLAWKLAEKGHQVFVFEKKEKIGKKTCSGLFSERILDFIPSAKQLIENQINSCLIHFPKKTIKVNFKKKFFVIKRFKLDNFVADLVKRAGAQILLNTEISKPPDGFDYIIGCDGYGSQTRKFLGITDPKFYLGIQGFVSQKDFSNYVEVWPQREGGLAPHLFALQKGGGFVWKIPRGKKIEYGIIGDIKPAKINFKKFLEREKIQVERISLALVPQGLSISFHPKIALCGNAMGLTKPWSGGGVVWGLTVADILLENFPDFPKAAQKIKKFFLPEIILSKTLTRAVYFFGFKIPWLLPRETKVDGDFFFRRRTSEKISELVGRRTSDHSDQ